MEFRQRNENEPVVMLGNIQNVSNIYREDVVRAKTNSKIGIVTGVAGDHSDSDLDEDENEDEKDCSNNETDDVGNKRNLEENAARNTESNDYKDYSLTSDQVRVLWMDGLETTESINEVTVVDRGFLQGDYVAAASDPTGQIGIVVDFDANVDLSTHDGSVLKDIQCKDLKRIREFIIGDHVVYGPWLGRIEDVFDNVTVLVDDGSVCKVIKADPLRLKPVAKNNLEDGHFPYYPGQRVKASSSSVFKNSRWLSGAWKANRLEGTVTKVTVGSLFVYWIASAGYGSDSASSTPAEEQSPKNLKLLSCFAHTNWQLGDWCFLPSSPRSLFIPLENGLPKPESCDCSKHEPESTETGDDSDAEMTVAEELPTQNVRLIENGSENCGPKEFSLGSNSKGAVTHLNHKKIRKVVVRKEKKSRKKIEKFERALLITSTKTKVDVVWQDGKIKRGLDTTSLIPIDSPGDHEFVAEQYVLEKAGDDSNDHAEVRRIGIVKSVNSNDRTACVRWLKPVVRPEEPAEFDKEEVVSVYELEGHQDYDYCYGEIVIRLSPVSLPAKMDSVEDKLLESSDESRNDKEKHHGIKNIENEHKLDVYNEFSDLSWVGNITGLKDGDIEVTWADGIISTVGPQAIYVVGRDDESIAGGTYSSDDMASWETVEDNNIVTVENEKEDQRAVDTSEIKPEIEESNIATESSGTNGYLSIPLATNESTSQEHEIKHQLSKMTIKSEVDECDVTGANDLTETQSKLKPPVSDVSPSAESISKFKGFDMVRDPFDHYFLGALGQNNASRKWLTKVQRDWDILQNNLPEAIYVRAYEDRMDLLRAVIVGAYGTPYQDGLFFFDFLLPPDYPDVPPSAYYHSGGWRINPNLYEEGKVCLSLLNTWTGRGNEVWDPSTSSILQVLVSLQGLVLNSKPYFNEAGYDKQIGTAEGEKNSLSYNENTFLLNCKTMVYLMRKPPKDFEELVVEYFKSRGYYILKACDAYMKGHLIGSLTNDASVSTDSNINNANSNSVGFKLMLAKVVPKLFSALNQVGADCQEFNHLIES